MNATAKNSSAADPVGQPREGEPAGFGEYLILKQAASELPCRRAGKRTHVATLYRWTEAGCRGVRLRYAMVGATRCTTRAWLAEFFDRLTSASGGGSEPAPASTVNRGHERAEQELAARNV